jgi:hypothetical protein
MKPCAIIQTEKLQEPPNIPLPFRGTGNNITTQFSTL